MAEIRFRTDDLERQELRERKKARTDYILESAGITKDNPDYNRWYLATLVNVHNAYRFSYNGETEADLERVFEGFISAIKENPIEKYEAATKEFLHKRVALQLDRAAGGYAKQAEYKEMQDTLYYTMISGIAFRKQYNTTFPKEFYKENGGIQRLVYEIPLEEQEESAMRNIDMIVAKYKDKGIEFSTEKNKFIVKGSEIGPEKFFTSKKDRLNKFLKVEKTFDASDQELFDVIRSGDFEKFAELRKQRGINHDKMNENLRNALADEIIFHEISECWNTKESQTPETLLETIRETSEKFSKAGEIVRKESEKDVLGRIDTIIFSVLPADLATQSTFKNWKSCMHATGCFHDRVDDSIGKGSIVAYGYDSREPYKMVSRLLIHPYKDRVSGEIAYKVNDRIYGRNNIGFRKAVAKVTEHFNKGKLGVYRFQYELYNDNNSGSSSFSLVPEKDGVIDLMDFRKDRDNMIFLSGLDLSKVKEIKVPEGVKMGFEECVFEGDLSKYEGALFDSCSFKNAILPENATLKGKCSFENTQFPETVDFQIYRAEFIKKYVDIRGIKLEEVDMVFKDIEIPDGVDLSSIKDLTINDSFKIGSGVKLPEKVVFNRAIIDQDLSEYQQTKMELLDCIYNENCKLPHTGNATIKNLATIPHENTVREIIGIPADKGAVIFIPKTVPIVQELLDTYSCIAVMNEKLTEKAKTQFLNEEDTSGIDYVVVKGEKEKKELLTNYSTLKVMTKEEFIQSGKLLKAQTGHAVTSDDSNTEKHIDSGNVRKPAKTNIQDKSDVSTLRKTIQSNQLLTDKERSFLQRVQKNPGME